MEYSVAKQFVILAINPVKGKLAIDSTHFNYSLSGAILLDYIEGEELKIEEKRVIPSLRLNNDEIHMMFAEQLSKSSRTRKISFWIRRLTNKRRFIMNEITLSLERDRIIRIEHKKFLGIISFRRYWFNNITNRTDIIDTFRGILIYGKKPSKKELMLLSVLHASKGHSVLSVEKGETKILRRKCTELMKSDLISSEINQTIKEVQSAIELSITAEMIATHAGH